MTEPVLPEGRGELSYAVVRALRGGPGRPLPTPQDQDLVQRATPYGEDLQLALYLCYELHYRGFSGVDPAWEWDSGLLGLRGAMERRFLATLRADAHRHASVDDALQEILVEPVKPSGISEFLKGEGKLWQLREYAAQRSLYHLKEADPHAWVIPRLRGRAKAAMAAVEFDEFGAGRAERVHALLYAKLMADLGLDTTYGRYLDAACAEMLMSVNLMSLFGLHRSLRGALVGHFAAVEVTSSAGARRMAQAMQRAGAGPAAVHFYTEHVRADAVHEQIVRRDVIGGLLEEDPGLEGDVTFGIDATGWAEDRLGARLLTAWRQGLSSLRTPLS
ncbi:iron-containing redox enzyme family protein [Streptomyces sp. NPDC052236]|uniref:iron-containing redox enzyme family protein n=1 Tax=Streptomyces sp. NPDC052236 TaxID=3365686 RepID=UPI0037D2E720